MQYKKRLIGALLLSVFIGASVFAEGTSEINGGTSTSSVTADASEMETTSLQLGTRQGRNGSAQSRDSMVFENTFRSDAMQAKQSQGKSESNQVEKGMRGQRSEDGRALQGSAMDAQMNGRHEPSPGANQERGQRSEDGRALQGPAMDAQMNGRHEPSPGANQERGQRSEDGCALQGPAMDAQMNGRHESSYSANQERGQRSEDGRALQGPAMDAQMNGRHESSHGANQERGKSARFQNETGMRGQRSEDGKSGQAQMSQQALRQGNTATTTQEEATTVLLTDLDTTAVVSE